MQYFISKMFREYIRMKNLDYKNKYIDTKYLNKYKKEPIFKSKQQSFRIKKIFYGIERQRIERQRRKN